MSFSVPLPFCAGMGERGFGAVGCVVNSSMFAEGGRFCFWMMVFWAGFLFSGLD